MTSWARSRADAGAPAITWGIHTHNDAELAVANSIAAVQAGVRHVQATINGYGERCGNANMVSILANLALKTPNQLSPVGGGDLAALTELSRSVAEIANVNPNDYQPYVGRSAFAHKGGVHGAAVAKVERSYQHVDPTAVGNAGRLVVSELGGRANTEIRARQLGHELAGMVDPRELSRIIKRLENEGLAFEGAEASFELLIRRQAKDYAAPFRIVDYTCLVEQRSGRELLAEATVKVEVAGETLHTAADGNGPVNALDGALRKALGAFYPGAGRGPPGGLQGAHPRRGHRDGRPDTRHHRLAGRLSHLEHDGQRHEHHRGVGAGAGGLAGVRDLEVGRGAPSPGRAPLHDGERQPDVGRGGRSQVTDAGTPHPPIRLERWTVTSGSNVNSRAAVVLHAGRHDWKASAEGNGAVDALLRAVDTALADVLGGRPVLIAYDVHALAEGPDAEGRVTVRIAPPAAAEGARSDGRYTGEVASTNIVAASVEAYVDALNAMLGDPSWAGAAEAAGSRRGRGRGAEPGGQEGTEFDDDARPIDTTEWFNI